MNTKNLFRSFLIIAMISLGLSASAEQATVDVVLHPAGSFKINTSEVKGFAYKKQNQFEAQNVSVNLKNIQTGISLRDNHTKKYLDVDHFPEATLVKATAQNGAGDGIIKIKGIEKPIHFTYEAKDQQFVAQFPLKLSDFQITGIKYMGIGVDDEVKVAVTLPIKAQNL